MANSSNSKSPKDKLYPDRDSEDIFTLKGYTNTFETCESNSDVFARLAKKIDEIDVDTWKRELTSRRPSELPTQLFSYWTEHCENDKFVDKNQCIKFIQIFSLLENVFRNTLLRPYIPAYRTINKNCGLYCSFVTKHEDHLFKELSFKDNIENLLTYQGQDPQTTIVYAITCFVFWHVLSMKLKNKSSIAV